MKKSNFQTAVGEDFAAMFLVAKLRIILKKKLLKVCKQNRSI